MLGYIRIGLTIHNRLADQMVMQYNDLTKHVLCWNALNNLSCALPVSAMMYLISSLTDW